MQITRSILCLWVGCAVCAACATFVLGAFHVEGILVGGGDYDGGDGPANISVNIPVFLAVGIGVLAALIALCGLLASRFLNKQAFFSRPHLASLWFLSPFTLALLLWLDVPRRAP